MATSNSPVDTPLMHHMITQQESHDHTSDEIHALQHYLHPHWLELATPQNQTVAK